MNYRLLVLCIVCALFFVNSVKLFAEDAADAVPDMTPEKLEKVVKRQFKYIDKRLLSGKSANKIEESGNQQAIDILQRSRESRDEIAGWIAQGRFGDAYKALQEISRSMKRAIQLSRAKERSAKKLKDEMDSARVANDAYFELVRKRGIADIGGEAADFISRAREARKKADDLRDSSDYKGATEHLSISTRLLKKATSLFRDKNR